MKKKFLWVVTALLAITAGVGLGLMGYAPNEDLLSLGEKLAFVGGLGAAGFASLAIVSS